MGRRPGFPAFGCAFVPLCAGKVVSVGISQWSACSAKPYRRHGDTARWAVRPFSEKSLHKRCLQSQAMNAAGFLSKVAAQWVLQK
jgi:hypothetical protein